MTPRITDEPFGLLTIAAPQHKLVANYLGNLTMQRALVSTIFAGLLAWATVAHAHPKLIQPALGTEAVVTQVTLQKASDTVKVRAPLERPAASVREITPPVESGWNKYGTLLATLVVMCAIALRRLRLGRS